MSDLISRKALREDLRRFFPTEVLEGIEPKTLFAQIMQDIDNAKTVPLPDFKEGYKQAIIDGKTNFSDRYDEGYSQGYIDGSTGADWKGGAV